MNSHTIRQVFGYWLASTALSVSGIPLAKAQSTAGEQRVLAVSAVELQLSTAYQSKRQFTGQVEAKRKSDLGFDRIGTIAAIHVDRGDEVSQGQLIATLDTEALFAQRKKLEADLRSAQAQLQEAETGPRQETIAAARASLAEQQSQLSLAQEARGRRESLHAKRLIAKEEFDQADATLKRWEAVVDAARSRLDELLEGTRQEQIDAQVAAVEAIEAAIAQIEVEIQKSALKSPYDGMILARSIDEGSVAAPGQSVVTIIEHRALEAKVGITPAFAKNLKRGQAIEAQAGDEPIAGTIKAVVAEVDTSTRTQPVIIALGDDAWKQVVPGDTLRLSFSRDEKSRGFWVPTECLVAGPRGLWNCFVIENLTNGVGTAQARTVEVLHTEGERSMISGQLTEGDLLVSSAPHRITAGQSVKPAVEASRP